MTNIQRAKAAIREAGLRFYCDKLKRGGWSLKVTDAMYVPIADEEVPERLFLLLVGASQSYKTRPQVYRAVRSGKLMPVMLGSRWTRFYFE